MSIRKADLTRHKETLDHKILAQLGRIHSIDLIGTGTIALFHSHGISPKDVPARSATVWIGDALYKFAEAGRWLPVPHRKNITPRNFSCNM